MPLNRTAIAAACAGALALAAWLLHARPQPKRPPADRAVVAMAGVPPAAAVAPESIDASAAMPAPHAASAAAPDTCAADAPVAGSEPASAADDDRGDVLPPKAAASPASAGRPPSARFIAATRRIDQALQSSADPYARAVGVWLDLAESGTTEARESTLVKLARESADPRLYALAFQSCRGAERCAGLDARRWAEVDPGNGMPWLYVMDEAARRGDGDGVADALYRVSTSTRMNDRDLQPVATILDAAGSDDGSLAAAEAAVARARGLAAAQFEPWGVVMKACGADRLRGDANLAQTCRAVARLWEERSDTLMVRGFGSALEFRVNGDAARRDALRAENTALAARQPTLAGTSCRQMRADLDDFSRAARVGELALARTRSTDAPPAAAH